MRRVLLPALYCRQPCRQPWRASSVLQEAYRWSEAKDAVVVTFELPCGHLVDPQALSAGLGANAVLLQARCFHAGGECPAYALAIDARLGGHVLDAGQVRGNWPLQLRPS